MASLVDLYANLMGGWVISGSQTFPSRGPFLDLATIGGPPPCIKIKRHVINHILLFNYYTMYMKDYMLAPRYSELGPTCIHVVHVCVAIVVYLVNNIRVIITMYSKDIFTKLQLPFFCNIHHIVTHKIILF